MALNISRSRKIYLSILLALFMISAAGSYLYKPPLYDTIRKVQYGIFAAGYFLFLAFLFYKGMTSKGSIKLFVFKITSILVSFIVLFLTAEVVTRVAVKSESDCFGFGPTFREFEKQHVKLNSKGYRDGEHDIKKTPGVSRMLVLGDSYTFGYGIKNQDDVYTSLLKKMINQAGNKKWEVINTGVPGAGTEKEVEIFREYLKYSPDLVLVGFHPNDVEGEEHKIMSWCLYEPFLPGIIGRRLRDNSYFYYFLETRYNRLLERLGWKMNYVDYMSDLYSDKSKGDWLAFDKNIRYLIDAAKKRNIKLAVCVFPIVADWKKYRSEDMHRRIDEYFRAKGVLILDLLPYYERMDYKRLLISNYDNHPNELGHKIAAEEIYSFLAANGLI